MQLYTTNDTIALDNFPRFERPVLSDLKRKLICYSTGKSLYNSLTDWQDELSKSSSKLPISSYYNHKFFQTVREFAIVDILPHANDPSWKDKSFGAVGDVEHSACLAFSAYNLFLLSQSAPKHGDQYTSNFLELVKLISNYGYRFWKFEKDPSGKFLNLPSLDVTGIKKEFPSNKNIQSCSSLSEIISILGKPIGLGGHQYFMDEWIYFLYKATKSHVSFTSPKPYASTRIRNVDQMLSLLKKGYPVPVNVSYSIFRNDTSLKDGHLLILLGIKDGYALTIDSSYFPSKEEIVHQRAHNCFYKCPLDRFIKSITSESTQTNAWDTSLLFEGK